VKRKEVQNLRNHREREAKIVKRMSNWIQRMKMNMTMKKRIVRRKMEMKIVRVMMKLWIKRCKIRLKE